MPSLERDILVLLDKLCLESGFCIPPVDAVRISQSASLTADEFASEVLRAEGMNPEYELSWYRAIRKCFIEVFGRSVSVDSYNPEAGQNS